MPIPSTVLKLIERFEEQLPSYKSGDYKEASLRREFLDPFFKALGWDIDNEQGYAEAYKDVVHEDTLRIGGAVKAPDYGFRIGGARKFFLEAKKPSVVVKEDISAAYQLRRYAWSAKLPLSILSDFEEFAVYDCRVRPNKDEKASKTRIFYCTFREYAEKWDWIYSIFSREAILKGSFDRYAQATKGKRGTEEVDNDFLSTIEKWRDNLAHNLAQRNLSLTQRELNFAVQRIIDRIIFLRICEDRGIEDYGRLLALTNGGDIYKRLGGLFYEADARYNSGLFHFKAERNTSEPPDEFTLSLKLDDKLLRDILKSLYYPDSPYEFSVLPADILGHVYEQFLGKVIRLTDGHRAVIEEKPEVRKAGGVYYTPTYIVDYIVKETVGKLTEGKTPKQIENLRFLDPACGSGSFLIGAYQYLLDRHFIWYMENEPDKFAKGKNPALVKTTSGWKLTVAERKKILLNNIYGVDIDSQAVEVTKLSLLLKVLEGETEQSIQTMITSFRERALPDLGSNIKCGNSLIGPDFYAQASLPAMSEEECLRINVFNWKEEFPEIFKAGGFDAVIGNPPYIRIQAMKEWAPLEVEHYKKKYHSASKGNYDIYVVFVEKGLSLLNPKGLLGFILPHKFFNAEYGESIREIIAKGSHLSGIVHFGSNQIFIGATTYTCLLFLEKTRQQICQFKKISNVQDWMLSGVFESGQIKLEKITRDVWNFNIGEGAELIEKLKKMPIKLGEITSIFVGLQTSADDVFVMDYISSSNNFLKLRSVACGKDFDIEKDLLFPLVSGTDVKGYRPLPKRQYILFPYDVFEEKATLKTFNEIERKFPKAAAYLIQNKSRLENREKGKFKDTNWHRFGRNQNLGIQKREKLCVPRLVDRLRAGFDKNGTYFLDNVDVGGLTIRKDYSQYSLLYILGLLNSSLLSWFFPSISAPFRGGWMSANKQFLSQIPFPTIDFDDNQEKTKHNKMVKLVEQMLSFHEQTVAARTPQEKTTVDRQIVATDSQIDNLVYELYGLKKEEIEIIERGRHNG